jgi:O-methyltransferase involved in polyketide biosynthesis
MSAAADSASSPVDEAVHVTAIMASATRALAIERFGIFGNGRGVFDRLIAGDAAISAASSVSAARLARMALRTWIVDRWLLQVSPRCSQVVLMGAGLDARCLCLPLAAATRVFELDLPVVMSLKCQVLSSTSFPHVTRVRLALPSLYLCNNLSPFPHCTYVTICLRCPATSRILHGLNCCKRQASCAFQPPGYARALQCIPSPPPLLPSSTIPHAFSMYLPPAAVSSMLHHMRQLSAHTSHLMLHSMPPPHPDESAQAHVPYHFTASAAHCSSLLRSAGWLPSPTVTYASALADVQAHPVYRAHSAQDLCDALAVASCSCDALTDAFAPYFIPAGT